MTDALKSGLTTIVEFVPKVVLFLIILLVGFFIAKAIAKPLSTILERVGFDRAVEWGGVRKALASSKYDASDVVSEIIYYALMLFVLQLAFGVFGPNPISDLIKSVIAFLPALIVAIIIVVAAAIAAAVRELISDTLGGLFYGKTLGTIVGVFILGLGIIAALNQIGVATTVTTAVLITVLATLGGILVIGVGGGLIQPMSRRWEGYLSKAEEEAPRIREHAANAPSAIEQAQARAQQARQAHGDQEVPRGDGAHQTRTPRH